MTKPTNELDDALRGQAEAIAAERRSARERGRDGQPGKVHDPDLTWQLEVHQVELEMQKGELEDAQVALARTRDLYQDLYERAPVPYLTIDEQGVICEANRRAAEMLRRSREALAGMRLSSFLNTTDADRFVLHHREALRSPDEVRCEVVLRPGGAATVPVCLLSVAVVGERGQPCCRTVLLDLTEIRQAAQRLQASEERFLSIAERVRDVFYVQEADGSVSYVSPAFEAIWGRPARDVVGRETEALSEMVLEADRPAFSDAVREVRAGRPTDVTYRIVRPDGQIRWIRDRGFPVTEDSHDRVVGVAQDVTKERQLEEELRQAQKMEAIGALASGVAHDFGNVLQAVSGSATMAADENTPPERARELMRRVAEAARRGKHMTRQLMLFNRKVPAEARPVLVDRVVDEAAGLLRRLVTEQIGVDVDRGAPDAWVLADPVQLEQILMNLGANARDAMPYGGSFSIRTEPVVLDEDEARRRSLRAGPAVRLTVSDTGSGMDEEIVEHIFEPFFTTKEVGQGTGLGLSTVFAITRQLGGHIQVASEVDRGTRFVLTLPCTEASSEVATSEPVTVAPAGAMALVVEDEPLVRRALGFYLEKEGYDVVQASSAAEAEELCGTYGEAIDLLVSDVYLPRATGPQLAERLAERCGRLLVLYVSGHARELLEDRGVLRAADRLLQKPFTREELVAELGALPPGQAPVT